MKQPLDHDALEKAFTLLGSVLERQKASPISIVVCGGSALIAANLIPRSTKDVDIVALLGADGILMQAEPLPASLLTAAALVAGELQLAPDWLNNGPCSIVNNRLPNQGLPEGFSTRLRRKKYGAVFTVLLIDRLDQIHFKVYAAADKGGPSYHLDDLVMLDPTDNELLAAARWAMMHDPTPEFRETVVTMFKVTGYERIAKEL